MNDANLMTTPQDAPAFNSLAELRAAHSELLKRYHELQEGVDESAGEPLPGEFVDDVQAFVHRGHATGALIDSSDDRWDGQGLLDYWATVLYRSASAQGQPPERVTLADFNPELAPQLPESACPYLGLLAFREEDQRFFFGRQHLIESMAKHFEEQRLLAVIGPSGSGKSSLVLAGLLPALKKGVLTGSADWQYLPPLIPGAEPLVSLAALFKPVAVTATAWAQKQTEEFKRDSSHLLRMVEATGQMPAVLVIDQCEELFTLASDWAAVQAFISNLQTLLSTGRHAVIVTMRSEFEPQFARLEGFYAAFQQARFQVTPLSASQLREAIEEPAKLIGLKFETGIVDALVNEILGEPAGLPLLQFTLRELWRRRDHNRITWPAYKELGGAREALSSVADRFYANLLPQEQEVVRRVLVRLGWTDGSAEVLRNRVTREVLQHVGGEPTDRVLQKLVATRLLNVTKENPPSDQTSLNDQFEVAHEALIRNWRTLVRWLEEERHTLRQRLLLRAASEQWRLHGGALLTGALLTAALTYHDLDKQEGEFVRASQQALEDAERAEEAARQREIQQARELTEAERRRADAEAIANRRLRLSFAVALVLLGLATAFGVYAGQQRRTAEAFASKVQEQTRLAEGEAKKARTQSEEAVKARAEAVRAAAEAIEARTKAEDAQQRALKLSEDLKAASATLERQNTDLLQNTSELQRQRDDLRNLRDQDQQKAVALAAALNSSVQATTEAESERKKALESAAKFEKANIETEKLLELSRSTQADGNIRFNDRIRQLEREALVGRSPAIFSPDAKTLLTLSADGSARFWDTSSGRALSELRGTSELNYAVVDPSGKFAAASDNQGTVKIWNVVTGKLLHSLEKITPVVTKLVFSPDSRQLVVASGVEDSRIVEVSTGKVLSVLKGRPIIDLSFSNDARVIATTDAERKTTLWKVNSGIVQTAFPLADASCRSYVFDALSFSPVPDLKVQMSFETRCKEETAPIVKPGVGRGIDASLVSPAVKALDSSNVTDEQRAKLKQAMDNAVTVVDLDGPTEPGAPNSPPTQAPNSLPAQKEPGTSPSDKPPGPTTPARPIRASTSPLPAAQPAQPDKTFRFVLDVFKRYREENVQLSHVSYSSEGQPEAIKKIEALALVGPSEQEVKAISDLVLKYRQDYEAFSNAVQGVSTVTDDLIEKSGVVSLRLFGEIMKVLGIAPANSK